MQINPLLHKLTDLESYTNKAERQDSASQGENQGTVASPQFSDRVFINQISPEKARRFVTNHIVNHLYNSHAYDAPKTRSADYPSYQDTNGAVNHISNVASQILNNLFNHGASQDQAAGAVSSTVQKGLVDASNILNSGNTLDDSAKTELTSLFDAITARLNNPPFTTNATQGANAHYESHKASASTSIQIQTKEGDVITIDISNNSSAEFTGVNAQGDGAQLNAGLKTLNSESNMSFTVKGDLNADELKAVNNILGKINSIADQFHNGSMEEALKQAGEFSIDDPELANVVFDMQASEQHREVNLAQPQVDTTATDPNQAPSDNASPRDTFLASLASLLEQFRSLVEDANKTDLFKNPKEAVTSLFQQILATKKDKSQDSNQTDSTQELPVIEPVEEA